MMIHAQQQPPAIVAASEVSSDFFAALAGKVYERALKQGTPPAKAATMSARAAARAGRPIKPVPQPSPRSLIASQSARELAGGWVPYHS